MYKVFIVDDEPFILSGLYDILDWELLGLEIVGQAENGQEALDKLKEAPVDLLITDISMPVMTGLELIRAALQLHPGMKVIVLSGYDEFKYVKEGLSLGIENYLLKPINLDEFHSTLEAVVEKLNLSREAAEWSRYSTVVLKENVLLRWMRNQISHEELSERLRLLDLPICKRFIQIALIQAEEDPENFRKTSGTIAAGMPGLYTFWDADNNYVLLHNFEDGEDGAERLNLFLEELTAGSLPGRRLRTAIGTVEETTCELHASYDQARQGVEFLAIHPERRMVYYEELKNRKRDLMEHLPEDWNEYTKRIVSKDNEGIVQIVDSYIAEERMDSMTPERLREVAMEWMLFFRMLVKDIRGEMREKLMEEMLCIGNASSLPELAAAIKTAAGKFIGLLEREVKSPVVNQVLVHIDTHFAADLSLKILGGEFNIHPVYLGQLFQKAQGVSFAEYLNRLRIEKAKELLRTSNRKVQEIAKNVGYWEMGYFYKQFKKYVGISPTEFKGLL